ncbi:MAG: hypothetical protein PHS09_01070 [Candidatus Omnitrophica bacterium]|jgi:hypothetical protein|nr:hypothetical protein [Candidatus Omnitrophota bacterium]MDD5512295.1 hypothetical protein [Candidatus Omnitrophota bacterium]
MISKRTYGFIFAVLLLLTISGCAATKKGADCLKEGARGLWGTSTKVLEEGRSDAISEEINHGLEVCYDSSLEVLKKIGAYVYAKDKAKGMIAIYVSNEDTTPVGIFFTQLDSGATRIEVTSPSDYAKETIATKLFTRLFMLLNPVVPQGVVFEKDPDA